MRHDRSTRSGNCPIGINRRYDHHYPQSYAICLIFSTQQYLQHLSRIIDKAAHDLVMLGFFIFYPFQPIRLNQPYLRIRVSHENRRVRRDDKLLLYHSTKNSGKDDILITKISKDVYFENNHATADGNLPLKNQRR